MNTEYIKARDAAAKYKANVLDPVVHNNAMNVQRFLGFIDGADWGRAYASRAQRDESPAVKVEMQINRDAAENGTRRIAELNERVVRALEANEILREVNKDLREQLAERAGSGET